MIIMCANIMLEHKGLQLNWTGVRLLKCTKISNHRLQTGRRFDFIMESLPQTGRRFDFTMESLPDLFEDDLQNQSWNWTVGNDLPDVQQDLQVVHDFQIHEEFCPPPEIIDAPITKDTLLTIAYLKAEKEFTETPRTQFRQVAPEIREEKDSEEEDSAPIEDNPNILRCQVCLQKRKIVYIFTDKVECCGPCVDQKLHLVGLGVHPFHVEKCRQSQIEIQARPVGRRLQGKHGVVVKKEGNRQCQVKFLNIERQVVRRRPVSVPSLRERTELRTKNAQPQQLNPPPELAMPGEIVPETKQPPPTSVKIQPSEVQCSPSHSQAFLRNHDYCKQSEETSKKPEKVPFKRPQVPKRSQGSGAGVKRKMQHDSQEEISKRQRKANKEKQRRQESKHRLDSVANLLKEVCPHLLSTKKLTKKTILITARQFLADRMRINEDIFKAMVETRKKWDIYDFSSFLKESHDPALTIDNLHTFEEDSKK